MRIAFVERLKMFSNQLKLKGKANLSTKIEKTFFLIQVPASAPKGKQGVS